MKTTLRVGIIISQSYPKIISLSISRNRNTQNKTQQILITSEYRKNSLIIIGFLLIGSFQNPATIIRVLVQAISFSLAMSAMFSQFVGKFSLLSTNSKIVLNTASNLVNRRIMPKSNYDVVMEAFVILTSN